MKKSLITIITILLLSSCGIGDRVEYAEKKAKNHIIITIDNCEYIYISDWERLGLAHKGNCKNTYHKEK